MGAVMPVWNALKDPGLLLFRGQFTALMAFMMDAQKDLRVDMGENFPCLGLYVRTKASTVLPRWECSIDVSELRARYGGVLTRRRGGDEGCFRDRSFEEM